MRLEKAAELEAGLDGKSLCRIGAMLEKAREERQFSGAAWAVARGGELATSGAVGSTDPDGDGGEDKQVDSQTLFDLASLTKPLSTAATVLALAEEGALTFSDPVRRFFPEAGKWWQDVTIRHLLTHTSGLQPYATFHEDSRGGPEIRDRILQLELRSEPGENYDYSCLGYILLQHIVTAVSGESLADLAQEKLFRPLELQNTTYIPEPGRKLTIASGGHCPHRGGRVRGEVHDPLAWAAGGVSGNAGLFSTAEDVCRWGIRLLSRRFPPLHSQAAGMMLRSQIPPGVGGHSFGFFTIPNGMLPRGEFLPEDTVGHTGFTGTSLVLCPSLNLVAVLLTNCLYYSPEKTDFFRTRRLFHNLVGSAVIETNHHFAT